MINIVLHVCRNMELEVNTAVRSLDISNVGVRNFPARCGHPLLSKDELDLDRSNNSKSFHFILGSSCLKGFEVSGDNLQLLPFNNCFELFLNKQSTEYFFLEGAYIITPGWLKNWKTNIEVWGFNRKTAHEFFKESCHHLLLLDTKLYTKAQQDLAELGKYLNVETRIFPIGMEFLKLKLYDLISDVVRKDLEKETKHKNQQLSQYAMEMDMISKLSRGLSENEIINDIILTMDMLFAPQVLYFLNFKEGTPDRLISKSGDHSGDQDLIEELTSFSGQYKWLQSGEGFLLNIKNKSEILGALKVGDFTFPDYKQHYLNLSLMLIDICSLAISNARNYKTVQNQRKQLIRNYNDLKETERKISTLIHNLPGAAYRCNNDKHRTMQFLSNGIRKISGYSPDEIIGNNEISYQDMIHPDDINLVNNTVQEALTNNTFYQIEYRLLAKDHSVKWVWERGEAVLGRRNEIVALEGFITDITERKQIEHQLKETDEQLQIINRILWHDVINSINVVKSAMRLFRKSKAMELIDESEKQSDKAAELIRRMRELITTIAKGDELVTTNVRDILEKLKDNYSIPVMVSGSCQVKADDAIISVLDNLISNAVRHASATKINIELENSNDLGYIKVIDNGKGIPDAMKEKVFQQNFTLGKTGNTGLGLYIVKKTIERFNGQVTVNDSETGGTIFNIILPGGS